MDTVQCIEEVGSGGFRIGHCQMSVVEGIFVMTLDYKTVFNGSQPTCKRSFADYLDRKSIQFAHTDILTARSGVLGYLLQLLSDGFLISRRKVVQLYQV